MYMNNHGSLVPPAAMQQDTSITIAAAVISCIMVACDRIYEQSAMKE